jgi:hypothetical protein
MKNEYLSVPYNLKNSDCLDVINLINKIINQYKSNTFLYQNVIESYSTDIDNIINNSFGLSEKEKININDMINYQIDLFHKGSKSKAFYTIENTTIYTERLCLELNEFLQVEDFPSPNFFACGTSYIIDHFTPIAMTKISFLKEKREIIVSQENLNDKLKQILKHLIDQKLATNIYFRKRLNYYDGDDIYIIRPNQRRFWCESMAMEDAQEIILEIMNG